MTYALTATAVALAVTCIRQAFRIARLNQTVRNLRWEYTDAAVEARLEVERLERKVAEYESLTGSWTAAVIEGGDA